MPLSFRIGVLSLAVSGMCLSLGCESDTTGPSVITPAQQYWRLSLNHHAITLATIAPYDTVQLIATPETFTGQAIPTTARPTFTTSDTSITIDSTGFIKVHGTQTKTMIQVIAEVTVGGATGLTLADTAIINVVQQTSAATVPVLTTFLFQPAAGDSARRAVIDEDGNSVTQVLADSVLDPTRTVIPNAVVRYTSSNTTVAHFVNATTGHVVPVSVGTVLLTAEAWVYGVSKIDSLRYLVGYSLGDLISVGRSYDGIWSGGATRPGNNTVSNGTVTIGVGGTVAWVNLVQGLPDDSLNIVFNDSTHVAALDSTITLYYSYVGVSGGGNIPAFGSSPIQTTYSGDFYYFNPDSTSTKGCIFPVPGTYAWHSTRQPYATGVVHVISNDSIH